MKSIREQFIREIETDIPLSFIQIPPIPVEDMVKLRLRFLSYLNGDITTSINPSWILPLCRNLHSLLEYLNPLGHLVVRDVLHDRSVKAQLRAANKNKSIYAIFVGPEEIESMTFKIKVLLPNGADMLLNCNYEILHKSF